MAVVVSLLSDEHHFRTSSAKRELGRVWNSELNRCDTTSTDSAELLWVRLTHKTQGNKELLLSRWMFSDLFSQKKILKIWHNDFIGAVSDACRQDDVMLWFCALGSLVSWAPPRVALPPVFLHLSYISFISSSPCFTQLSRSPLLSSTRSLHLCFSTSLHLHLVLSSGLLSSVISSVFCCHPVPRSSSVLCVPAFLLPGFWFACFLLFAFWIFGLKLSLLMLCLHFCPFFDELVWLILRKY